MQKKPRAAKARSVTQATSRGQEGGSPPGRCTKMTREQLVKRVMRLLKRVKAPLAHLRREAERKVDQLVSSCKNDAEAERAIAYWERRSRSWSPPPKDEATAAGKWVTQLRIARLGNWASQSEKAAAYKKARWQLMDKGIQVPLHMQSALDKLRRWAAVQPADERRARLEREARAHLHERLRGKRPPAKRRRYRVLYFWKKLHRDGQPPTQLELIRALAEDREARVQQKKADRSRLHRKATELAPPGVAVIPPKDTEDQIHHFESDMRHLFADLGLSFTADRRGPKPKHGR